MSHNSEFARREVYLASYIGLFCSSLWAHIMTGCDTVSYIFGKGKKKSFTVAMANASDVTEMMQFGDNTHGVTEAVTDVCRNFFLKLYGDFSGNLDYELICSDVSREISGNCPQQRMPSGTTCCEPCTRLSSARKLTCPH